MSATEVAMRVSGAKVNDCACARNRFRFLILPTLILSPLLRARDRRPDVEDAVGGPGPLRNEPVSVFALIVVGLLNGGTVAQLLDQFLHSLAAPILQKALVHLFAHLIKRLGGGGFSGGELDQVEPAG